MTGPTTKQYVVVDPAEVEIDESQVVGRVLLVDSDGNPISLGGEPARHTHAIADVDGLQEALDALDARIPDGEGA